jgi:predicted deacylase
VICTVGNQVTTIVFAAKYRTYDTLIESFKSFATIYPSLVSYEVVGKTVQGKDILMFKIGNPYGGRVLIDGAIHGDENLGSELLYFFVKWLLTSSDPLAKRILMGNYLLLIPALNVDSYGKYRTNANGVDLNRNFATGWNSGGSTDPTSKYYRGPAPLSEPESQALVQVFKVWKPSFYINLHRGGSVLYGSKYCNSTYYSMLYSRMVQMAKERQVAYYGFQSIWGYGFAISDAAKAGITSFLLELVDWQEITLEEIETKILPKFIPVIAVLCQECERKTIFEDGFESGSLSAWSGSAKTSGSSIVVSNVKPYEGEYSAKFITEASISETERAFVYKRINESSVIYVRVYIYIDEGLPLVDKDDRFTPIQFLNSKGSIICNLQIRHVNGEDRFTILAYDKLATTTEIYPKLKTWYCLGLYIKIHSTEGEIKAYINGVECISYTNIDTAKFGNVSIICFGLANSIGIQNKVTVYCDSAAISYIEP